MTRSKHYSSNTAVQDVEENMFVYSVHLGIDSMNCGFGWLDEFGIVV